MMSILANSPTNNSIPGSHHAAELPASHLRDLLPAPPIDRDRLLELCLDNVEFALVLLQEFETTSQLRLDGFSTALAQQDSAAIVFKAHAFKGVVSILAADALMATCVNLEAAAKTADWDKTRALVQHLHHEMQRAINFIPNICASP